MDQVQSVASKRPVGTDVADVVLMLWTCVRLPRVSRSHPKRIQVWNLDLATTTSFQTLSLVHLSVALHSLRYPDVVQEAHKKKYLLNGRYPYHHHHHLYYVTGIAV